MSCLPARPSHLSPPLASSAAPAATFEHLPIELLVAIFTYTPHLARLRALAPVCKRWRKAALRSIKSFVWEVSASDQLQTQVSVEEMASLLSKISAIELQLRVAADGAALTSLHRPQLAPESSNSRRSLATILSLLSGLTALELRSPVGGAQLPTSLQRLRIDPPPYESDDISYLSAQYPLLTSFALGSERGLKKFARSAIVRFLRAHSHQITELTLPFLVADFVSLQWPGLRNLDLSTCWFNDTSLAFLHSIQPLQELSIRVYDLTAFMALPDRYLAVLKSIHFMKQPSSECIKRLRQSPRLDEIISENILDSPPATIVAEHEDLYARMHRYATLIDSWEELRSFPSVRWLRIENPQQPNLSVLSQLTCLRHLAINAAQDPSLRFTELIFRHLRCNDLETLHISFDQFPTAEETLEAQLPYIHDFMALVLSSSVRSLILLSEKPLKGLIIPDGYKYGWCKLTVR